MNSARRRIPFALLAAVVLTTGGCDFDPTDIPIPGSSMSGATYPLHIRFADVLNLPPGAKVIADGVQVGTLTGVHITDTTVTDGKTARGYVTADIEVREDVRLPSDLTVELRQATPLGDVHIALTSSTHSTAPVLATDAVIPLTQTTRVAQVEDTMAGLATALGSGMVTDIQDAVRQINAVLPADPRETARAFGTLGRDLTDVAGDLGSLDQLLNGLNAVNSTAVDYLPTLRAMLTDDGTRHLVDTTQAVISVFYIFTNLGPVAHSALWLAPLVSGLDAAATAYVPMLFGGRPLDLNSGSNLSRLLDLLHDKVIPLAQHPQVNVTRVEFAGSGADGSTQTGRVIDTLRMIGMVK